MAGNKRTTKKARSVTPPATSDLRGLVRPGMVVEAEKNNDLYEIGTVLSTCEHGAFVQERGTGVVFGAPWDRVLIRADGPAPEAPDAPVGPGRGVLVRPGVSVNAPGPNGDSALAVVTGVTDAGAIYRMTTGQHAGETCGCAWDALYVLAEGADLGGPQRPPGWLDHPDSDVLAAQGHVLDALASIEHAQTHGVGVALRQRDAIAERLRAVHGELGAFLSNRALGKPGA